jgi:hypothetical protein
MGVPNVLRCLNSRRDRLLFFKRKNICIILYLFPIIIIYATDLKRNVVHKLPTQIIHPFLPIIYIPSPSLVKQQLAKIATGTPARIAKRTKVFLYNVPFVGRLYVIK